MTGARPHDAARKVGPTFGSAPPGAPRASTLASHMPTDSPALADADLVTRAQSGDRDALGALYDRYAATVFDLCAHMLRDRDAAADATADVFLAAAEHIDELQDPTKVKSWLYAIARNEVYRRGRTREAPMAEVGDVTAPVYDTAVLDEPLAAPDDTAALLREASLGLADRDRMVLEMTLAGGLDGRALGDALGVSVDAAHQASHRMRDRLARSVGALLVARQGTSECPALRGVLDGWDGSFSVLWRKRVARHVDRCQVCGQRGRSVREKVLTGTFAALPLTLLSPPAWLRDRILGEATMPPDLSGPRRGGNHWRRDGFPPVGAVARRRRVLAALLGGAAVVLLLAGGVALLTEDDGSTTSIVAREQVTTTRANGNSAREAPSSAPGQPGVLVPGTDPTSTTSTTKPKVVAPPPPPPPADTTGPTLKLSGDAEYTFPCSGTNPPPLVRADVLDPSGISTVTGTYSGPASGSFTMAPVGGTGWEKRVPVPLVGSYTITVTARDAHGNPTTASRGLTAWNCIG